MKIKQSLLIIVAVGTMFLSAMHAGGSHGKPVDTQIDTSQKEINENLRSAARLRSWEDAKEALDNGADIYTIDRHGRTPLHIAAGLIISSYETGQEQERMDFIKNLIDYVKTEKDDDSVSAYVNAKINGGSYDGWTPLHSAALVDSHDAAEFLLESGAEVDARSAYKNTPLHISSDTTKTSELLRKRGAYVDAENSRGEKAYVSI